MENPRQASLIEKSDDRDWSVEMKNLFHYAPPFVRGAVFDRLLAGLAAIPPPLGGRVSSHFCHIGGEVVAGVLEVAEEVMLAVIEHAQVDRVVPDVAFPDRVEDAGPDRRVKPLVFLHPVGMKREDHAVSFGCVHGMYLDRFVRSLQRPYSRASSAIKSQVFPG